MKTGSLRTLALGCGALLLAATVAGCASKPRTPRDVAFRQVMDRSLGFSGRTLVVHLGQDAPVRLRPSGVLLQDGLLILEEENHRFNALRSEDLHLAWSYDGFKAPLRYAPVLSTVAFVGMTTTRLHQVNLEYGHNEGGTVHFDIAPSANIVASAGTAYVPAWGGSRGQKTLRTLNLVTGLEGWGWRTPGDVRGAMAIGGQPPRQSVYFATDGGEVYALPATEADAPAPEPLWVQKTHAAVTADLVVSGDELFVSSQDGFLYCMDRITGGVKWAAPHETPLLRSATATAGSVYQFRTGGLWCHDRASGAVRWKLKGAARLVLERDGKSLVQMTDGSLATVDASGKVVGTLSSGGYVYPTNTVDGSLFAVGTDGFVIKLEVGGE